MKARITNTKDGSAEVYLYGEIGRWMDVDATEVVRELERMQAAISHAERFLEVKPIGLFPELRKHMSWYSKGMRGSMELRRRVNTAKTPREMLSVLYEFKNSLEDA